MPSSVSVIARLYVGLTPSQSAAQRNGATYYTHRRAQVHLNDARDMLTGTFGGCTSWEAKGRYVGVTRYDEECVVIEVLIRDEPANRATVREVAGTLARELGQECVMLTFQPVEAEFVLPLE